MKAFCFLIFLATKCVFRSAHTNKLHYPPFDVNEPELPHGIATRLISFSNLFQNSGQALILKRRRSTPSSHNGPTMKKFKIWINQLLRCTVTFHVWRMLLVCVGWKLLMYDTSYISLGEEFNFLKNFFMIYNAICISSSKCKCIKKNYTKS